MGKNQMSVNAQIGLTLGVLMVFSIVCTIAGYFAGDQTREKIALFASEPVHVDGKVTKKHIDIVRPTQGAMFFYWLDVSFPMENGTTRNDSIQVVNSIYDHYNVGVPVPITYARSKPEWFFVPGTAATVSDISMSDGMFEYGLMATAVFFVGFLAWYFTGRSESYAGQALT